MRTRARQFAAGALFSLILIPALFYLRFGEVPTLGWGLTGFFFLYCLITAIGLTFLERPEYHTTVQPRGGWLDRIGAFWLVACTFTPLLGWFLTTALTLTLDNWRFIYGLRVALCFGLPVLTALPLLRYAQGKAARVALPLLIGVTLISSSAGYWCLADLLAGPQSGRVEVSLVGKCLLIEPVSETIDCRDEWAQAGSFFQVLYLSHTGNVIPNH